MVAGINFPILDTLMPLTGVKIRQAKPSPVAVKLTDGGGLYLELTPGGNKLWRYRFRLGGKENTYAVGAYPACH